MFLFPIGLIAQNEMELDNAFEAYDNGEYEKALGLFNSIEKSNVKNAEFFSQFVQLSLIFKPTSI